jgi:hypothetical protein
MPQCLYKKGGPVSKTEMLYQKLSGCIKKRKVFLRSASLARALLFARVKGLCKADLFTVVSG